ncbi:16S rRNA (uracil(1498)-N(3))-methyltransferase [Lactobacillus alvi]|uniref:Ribosomal RNA small subunit methyltransferase E n=1 Tax=Limosilactobacillus alvi TaxID=990412 RepID=A0ABS2EPZ4_9LACO|nr:16S rRNA (uracil(1498)-N(3))-methyltransferase [Limosilactobacillus alvi]
MQRYFLPYQTLTTQPIQLPKEQAHHLLTVLRGKIGTSLEIVLADHCVYQASVNAMDPVPTVQIDKKLAVNAELPVRVIVACGLPKTKEKPELIVKKGTELGANHFIFFESERSVSHWDQKKITKKLARLAKIIEGAAEQSHRNSLPTLEYLPNLQAVTDQPADVKLVAWEESAKQGETGALVKALQSLQPGQTILALFGPEGGLTETEVTTLKQAGYLPAGLGPRILRAETAPLYFLATVSYQLELLNAGKSR